MPSPEPASALPGGMAAEAAPAPKAARDIAWIRVRGIRPMGYGSNPIRLVVMAQSLKHTIYFCGNKEI